MIDLEEIISEWQNEKTEYESLGKFMQTFLSDRIFESGLKCEVSFRTKDLVSIIKKIKKKRKKPSKKKKTSSPLVVDQKNQIISIGYMP